MAKFSTITLNYGFLTVLCSPDIRLFRPIAQSDLLGVFSSDFLLNPTAISSRVAKNLMTHQAIGLQISTDTAILLFFHFSL